MTVLDAMSVVISCGNVAAGWLVGPAVVALYRRVRDLVHARVLTGTELREWARRGQGIGWVALFAAQIMLVSFGFTAGYPGFQWIQPLMIPAALMNFWFWRQQGRIPAGGAR